MACGLIDQFRTLVDAANARETCEYVPTIVASKFPRRSPDRCCELFAMLNVVLHYSRQSVAHAGAARPYLSFVSKLQAF